MAKLIPEKIIIIEELSGYSFWWNNEYVGTDDMEDVRDTEWLNIVHLIEGSLPISYYIAYANLILKSYSEVGNDNVPMALAVGSSFNRRASAMCAIKVITP